MIKFQELKALLGLNINNCATVNECMIIFNRSPATDQFMKNWLDIITISYTNELIPYYELVEIGMAMELTPNLRSYNTTNDHDRNRGEHSLFTLAQGTTPHYVL